MRTLMLVVAGLSLFAINAYQGDLARAEQVFWLKYFLSSQSAIFVDEHGVFHQHRLLLGGHVHSRAG